MDDEALLRVDQCEEGCSKCCGPKSFIALTSDRVIARDQAANCCCCCTPAHVDTAINLHDIEVLKESRPRRVCSCWTIFILIITCTWPFALIMYLLNLCCGCCCGDRPKYIAFRGGFGKEVLTFKASEAVQAANDISAMIKPYKERKFK